MTRPSKGEVSLPLTPNSISSGTSSPFGSKTARQRIDENRPKVLVWNERPRLASPQKAATASNRPLVSSKNSAGLGSNVLRHSQQSYEEASGNDEKALMEDLMAGLDATMFEGLESSPVHPRSVKSSQISPSKQKGRRNLAPIEIKISPGKRKRPLSPTKWLPQKRKIVNSAFAPSSVKAEVKSGPAILPVKPIKIDRERALVEEELKALTCAGNKELREQKVVPELLQDELYDFDFDFGDLSAFDEDLLAPSPPQLRYPIINPVVPPAPPGYTPTPWVRCTVDAVFDGLRFGDGTIPKPSEIISDELGGTSYGKTLVVTLTKSGDRRVVHLKERWADLHIKKGNIINIISPCIAHRSTSLVIITFKDPSSFLVHHPDLMLTMTSIANAMPCPRKPILQTLVKTSGPPTKAVLYGNLLHTLLQGALAEQSFDADGIFKRIDIELKKEERRMEIWSTGMGILDVREDIGAKAGRGFEVFGERWVGAEPKLDGELHTNLGENSSLLAINGLHEVEEDIWSPKWGLKGKVDASVQAKVIRDPARRDSAEEHVAPLEIKTGRSVGVMAHRAQTMLYTLLMEDRYCVPVPAGLLYYSQLDSILRVEAKQNEIRALIIARNELADWLSKKRRVPQLPSEGQGYNAQDVEEVFLPSTIDHPRECRSCYAVDSCMLYRKAIDNAPPDPEDPIAELYQEKTGHMSQRDAAFFKKWDTLLTVEEQDIGRYRSQLWTMTAKDREKTGRCFSDMVINSYSNDIGKSLAKIHRHTYTFVRAPRDGTQAAESSLLSGHIAKGDPVSLSIEPDLLCLARGYVVELSFTTISIGVAYVIDVEALLKRTGRLHEWSETEGTERRVVFRIDKDEMASGMMRMRNNLAHLFYAKNGDETRRRLIVDLDRPDFEPSWRSRAEDLPQSLNEDQRRAMDNVMMARDYSLILGMPGTGKTTTVAEIIKMLVERGKTVLLTSYTHSAVDTILMKLVNAEFGVLRLGNIDKVHPDVQHLTLEAMESSSNMEQIEARLMRPPVVAATCLAIDHPLFFRRRFDYCIVDEASQITLPTCLGPLRMADRFVLVGDHFQLPPTVRHPEARKGGLDVSLFKHLSSAHPQAVSELSYQYRMNEDIMMLSNQLVYEGKLKCGSEEVAKRGLILDDRKACGEIFGSKHTQGHAHGLDDIRCWIQELMDESVKCVFVDTDEVPALDSRVGDLVQNEVEAKLVQQLATALTSSGLKSQNLAIITPYRQQIKLLTSLIKPNLPSIEILTADKSQGRDKDVILISLVRSNDSGNVGDLLKDWRRINVSITRSKKKLVIFGSGKTLSGDPLLKKFLALMESMRWIKRLKKGDDLVHELQGRSLNEDKEVVKREKKVVKGRMGVLGGGKVFAKEIMSME
ncbi:hypothetical protein IAR55_003559 [Kwoniella newhampshirensis]|uniref:DNA replication ATP-dependent helicase/nuclease DNA2 n=1 Tax=Kwoniella newhampshirensis TaxID=1651941 RepID=A0AAW0YMU0_9TREE